MFPNKNFIFIMIYGNSHGIQIKILQLEQIKDQDCRIRKKVSLKIDYLSKGLTESRELLNI